MPESLLLDDSSGKLVTLGQFGHARGVNHKLFVMATTQMRQMWLENAVKVIRDNMYSRRRNTGDEGNAGSTGVFCDVRIEAKVAA